MPIDKNSSAGISTSKKLEPLPPDVYAVEVLDVEEREGTKFNSQEKETQFSFKLGVIEEGAHYGRLVFAYCSPKLVSGKKPSKLYQFLVAATGRDYTVDELDKLSSSGSAELLNPLIGKQLRVTLSVADRADGQGKKNKIDSYMVKKLDLPAFDKVKAEANYNAPALENGEVAPF